MKVIFTLPYYVVPEVRALADKSCSLVRSGQIQLCVNKAAYKKCSQRANVHTKLLASIKRFHVGDRADPPRKSRVGVVRSGLGWGGGGGGLPACLKSSRVCALH